MSKLNKILDFFEPFHPTYSLENIARRLAMFYGMDALAILRNLEIVMNDKPYEVAEVVPMAVLLDGLGGDEDER